MLFLTNLKRENDFVEVPDAMAPLESGIYGDSRKTHSSLIVTSSRLFREHGTWSSL